MSNETAVSAQEEFDTSAGTMSLVLGVIGVVAGLGALIYLALFPPAEPAYTIDGEEVSRAEFAETVEDFAPDLVEAAEEPTEASDEQRARVALLMTGVIVEDILQEAADEAGVDVDDAAIDEELDTILQEGFQGDQAAFDATVEESGLTDAGIRQQVRTTLLINALAEATTDAEVSEEQVQQIYEAQFALPQVSHILVETEEAAQEAIDRIEAGEEFADVAMEVSIDGSAANGGQLGPLVPGQFVAEFEEAAQETEPGEITGPVETQFGFHVITVDDPPPLEEVRDQIEQGLREQSLNTAVQTVLQELEDEVEITVDADYGEWVGLLQGGLVPPQPAELELDTEQ